MTNQKTMTIAEYQLSRPELNGCEVHHRGYRVVSVTSTMLDGQSPEYWIETEGGCGSFAGTEIVTITQRNTLNGEMTTNEQLFEKVKEGLALGNAYAGMIHGDYESPLITNAESALATLRQRVTDLEAFYQHMVGADYQNDLKDTLFDNMMDVTLDNSDAPNDDAIIWRDYDALLERLSNGT